MSLADLRKELKEMRKSAMPTPVSRMKKTDVARELERLKGLHGKEEKKVEEVIKKEEVPKKVVEKVKKVVKPKAEEAPKPSKFIKGSPEAKEKMAKLREMRKKKSDE
jgi:5,10-methenyltetrahydromethanopterin hydrogenase